MRVLDVGCGTGATTVELAQRVLPGGSVLGVDIADEMLRYARQRTASPAVDFRHGDVEAILFTAESFDCAFSRFGVLFFDEPESAFANIRRALRPGGRLAFVSWQPLERNEWMLVPATAAAGVLDVPVQVPSQDGPGPFALSDPKRIRTLLGAAGFRKVRVHPHNDQVSFPVAESMAFAAASSSHGGIRTMLLDAEADAEGRVHEAIAAALRARATAGVVELSRGSHVVVAVA